MNNRMTNLPLMFTFQMNVTASGTPEQLSIKRRAATIAFVQGANENVADTITDSASGFVTAGIQAGDMITVSGSASNDGTFEVTAVAAGTITVHARHALVTEGAGATVKIVASKTLVDGVGVTLKAKNGNTGVIHLGYSSATALNTAGASFTLDNNESVSIQVSELSSIWLDATVSGEGVEVFFEKNVQG